jgi:hypothetical protein
MTSIALLFIVLSMHLVACMHIVAFSSLFGYLVLLIISISLVDKFTDINRVGELYYYIYLLCYVLIYHDRVVSVNLDILNILDIFSC